MKRMDFRTVVVVLLAAAAGCKGDPTADLRTGVSQLALNPDIMFMDSGVTKPFEVVPRDQQLNPVAAAVTVTSADPAVFTVEPDSAVPSADNAHHDYIVTAVGLGQSRLIATSGGVSDTAIITVLPTIFGGVFSSDTVAGGDTLVIASTSQLKFSPADVVVTFSGDLVGTVVSATADTLKVLVPFGVTNGPVTIDGVAVTYAGVNATLATLGTVVQVGDLYTGDEAYATAPELAIPPAAGDSTFAITNFPAVNNTAICGEASGPCTIFKYVVAGPDSVELTFTVDWDSDADLDIYSCSGPSAATCFEDPGTGATADQPQTFTFTAAPGTHYLGIENFDHTPTDNVFVKVVRN